MSTPANRPPPPMPDEVLYEIRPNGRYLRVAAIDPKTGIEAVSIMPSWAREDTIKENAARKLAWVLQKHRESGGR
ncbi:hypothetical protein IHV25_04090 [Phaeovibrio sulfidiphilus]|uniref:DUF6898 domain-containing protein n=1 Tax=Phaeovibrio sulfidiphilus TaxID=1220600 RepID=A0A8J6YPH3_9PROT|nr:hypothetical protein [Phaeovibrio sulfidiphilus]MBE1236832.1 hypothetical protein [Phaeovibrio sulfidiphilus]